MKLDFVNQNANASGVCCNLTSRTTKSWTLFLKTRGQGID